MTKTRILGIDPGGKTGYAIIDVQKLYNGEDFATIWDLVGTGMIKFKTPLDYHAQMTALYRTYKPSFVVYEQPHMGHFPKVVISLTEKVTIMKMAILLEYPEALIVETTPSEWRKVLGIKQPKRKKGEPSIIKDLTIGEIARIMGVTPHTLLLAHTEHEVEAIGIALSKM